MGLDSRVTLFLPADGSSLTFDVCESESFSPRIDVTEHPIEDGSVVNDHAQVRALTWTARCGITDTPYDSVVRGDSGAKTGQARVAATIQFLRKHQGEAFFYSSTKTGLYTNAVVTGWDYESTASGVTWFSLGLKQIRIATATTVEIPARTPRAAQQTGLASGTDSGVQSTTTSAADVGAGSIAHGLLGALGIDLGEH